MTAEQKVLCKRCDKPVNFDGAILCNSCWEVEYRLDDYLRSTKAREFILNKISSLKQK